MQRDVARGRLACLWCCNGCRINTAILPRGGHRQSWRCDGFFAWAARLIWPPGEALVTEHAQLLDSGPPACHLSTLTSRGPGIGLRRQFALRRPGAATAPAVCRCAENRRSIEVQPVSSWYISSRAARSSLKTAPIRPWALRAASISFLTAGGEAIAANQDHGVRWWSVGAVVPALGRSQLNLGHPRIICGPAGRDSGCHVRSAGNC